MAKIPGTGVDRHTGRPVSGWPHVENSLECIFNTYFGTRPIRRWFGSYVPRLLGENIEPSVLLKFFVSVLAALALEPRVELIKINILSNEDQVRSGALRMELELMYRPRGHLGDYTTEGARRVVVGFFNEIVRIERAA